MSGTKYVPTSEQSLEREAQEWDSLGPKRKGWVDAPEAIPRVGASTLISLRVPKQMLEVLKAFAERQGVGYQVLIKRWLDERIRQERDKLAAGRVVGSDQPRAGRVSDAPSPGISQELGDLPEEEMRFIRELVGFLREKAKKKKEIGTKRGKKNALIPHP